MNQGATLLETQKHFTRKQGLRRDAPLMKEEGRREIPKPHTCSQRLQQEGKKGRLRATRRDTVGLPASRAGSQMPSEKPTQQLLLESLPSDKTHQNKTTENSQGGNNLLPIVSSKAFSFLNIVCERRCLLAFLCMKMCCVYACG